MNKYYKKISLAIASGLLIPLYSVLAVNIQNPAPGFFADKIGDGSFKTIFTTAINSILLPLAGIVAMLFIIIGGFQYITSSGDEEAAAKGKRTLQNAIIGLIIVILSYVIVTVIINAAKGRV